jgi:hypothetical protein
MNALWTALFVVYLLGSFALIARSFRNQPHDETSCPVCQNADAMSGRDIELLLVKREKEKGAPLAFRARTDERGDLS